MEKLSPQLEEILRERYGKDSIIAVATMKGEIPCVRYVDGLPRMERALIWDGLGKRKMQR